MNKALLFPGVLALAVAIASCNPQDNATQSGGFSVSFPAWTAGN